MNVINSIYRCCYRKLSLFLSMNHYHKKKKSKIFGIGLNRTGTTSLQYALEILGYKVAPYNIEIIKAYLKQDWKLLDKLINSFDAFQDWPWPLMYKTLDKKYPNSKFILTTRSNVDIWLKSQIWHTINTNKKDNTAFFTNKIAYGYFYPGFHEAEHKNFYLKFNNEVRNYFKYLKKDFIELCWEKNSNWNKLCKFLNKEYPNTDFPYKRKSSYYYYNKIKINFEKNPIKEFGFDKNEL